MHHKHLFEYAVIRIVPLVEREEFVNAGVILYCASHRFLQCLYSFDKERLQHFAPELDVDEVCKRLAAFGNICTGSAAGGPIAKLSLASRFRWLTATRSTIIQTSPVHPGLCNDPQQTLMKLHRQLVD